MVVLFRRLRKELAPIGEIYRERNQMAREWDLPRQWLICPICAAQDWVLPPHGLEPCPLIVQYAEEVGLKVGSERMASLRAGLTFEEVTRQLRSDEE